eukprot:CAMPEP_0113934116 /NCGR_PEP_ID=MMETSP1339-20121228/1442_1 /TAXON_ID=94617 /ORGANISM="Fibrocapsa japonica" /LENGTH=323 /DNA_ID=CAMNT_0000935769 /DNA_START=88 /DNA_END=1059 /DNA_ORIENTATION=+ /assembly_acc=CAM_ASM_000762
MEYKCGSTTVKIDDVVEIARKASAAIMEVYESDVKDWDIKAKSDDSPLTKADLAANKVICEELKKLYPDIPIVSEENKAIPYEERKGYQYFFCVDPLDGTKEFVKRNGQFTVNIGLCDSGKPVLGVVGVPAGDVPWYYFGVVGEGASMENDADRYPESIRCKTFDEDSEGLTLVASASHLTKETEDFMAQYKNPKTKSMGSSLKLLLVAQGEAHIYPRLAPTSEWDTCAAHAIVEAAGGEVLQYQGGKDCDHLKPLVYNKPDVLNPWFVVYGKRKAAAAEDACCAGGVCGVSEGKKGGMNFLLVGVVGVLAAVVGAYFAQKTL